MQAKSDGSNGVEHKPQQQRPHRVARGRDEEAEERERRLALSGEAPPTREPSYPPPSADGGPASNVQVVEGINCLWVDERNVHECPICSSAFSFFRRKHHCRACGGVFCWYCTETRIKLIVVGSLTEQLVRICDMCAKKAHIQTAPVLESFIPDDEMKDWHVLIHSYDHTNPQNNKRLREKIKNQEVPDVLRSLLWQALTGSAQAKKASPYSYAAMLERELDPHTEERLHQDLARTFSDERLTQIKCKRIDSRLVQQRIFNVLKAFCLMYTNITYEQGMSFIAGVLVLLTDEEHAFWMFVQVMRKFFVAGMYKAGTPVLKRCVEHFKSMVSHLFPDLDEHFNREGITVEIFANQWFLTLYSYNFPLNFVFRIWDLFLSEGIDFILTMALAIFCHQQDKLTKLNYMETMTFLSTLPSVMHNFRSYINIAIEMLEDMASE